MDIPLWMSLALVILAVIYLLATYAFYYQSREADKHIDYSKMKEWKDDED